MALDARTTPLHIPLEIFLHILDQLVGTKTGTPPIAYAQSDPITKTLRSLTLVSKQLYPVATRYLFSHCLYIDSATRLHQLQRTLGFKDDIGYCQAGCHVPYDSKQENHRAPGNVQKAITSVYLSPKPLGWTTLATLPQVVGLLGFLAPTLKRLAINLEPGFVPDLTVTSSVEKIFSKLTSLEELICSAGCDVFYRSRPPNLKRLAMDESGLRTINRFFCFAIPSLERLVVKRCSKLSRGHIEYIFEAYDGAYLDVLFVHVAAKHGTPEGSRDFKPDDKVHLYELDVPTSYYGDEDESALCREWIWQKALHGTLWAEEGRKMENWSNMKAKSLDFQET